jgi:predicted lipoprotein with Yx(FWY)xxD motif
VLVNGQGRTLYLFMPEKGAKVKCTGSCASLWPPVKSSSGTPSASGGAHAGMLSKVADPAGGSIVTYAGWPLHTYASDSGPGSASGQGIDGQWYVVSPTGTPITKKASSSSSGGSSSGGGYGGGY